MHFFILITIILIPLWGFDSNLPVLQLNPLSDEEKKVILYKGTETPYSGKYYKFNKEGIYLCKHCNAPLYKSSDKFESGCGWPSFDDAIPCAIKKTLDADGYRTEISCAHCRAHLGHVFIGEHFTKKNTRYCVNSISLKFQEKKADNIARAYFAGGCFWGMEYYFEKLDGVEEVTSGFMGGDVENPGYYDVVRGGTGHFEVIEVLYNPKKVTYETLARRFFEVHDPTQKDGQGPDIGERYHSVVFVNNYNERKIAEKLINILKKKGYDIATTIRAKKQFYKAEKYHQNYYKKKGTKPYCHRYVKRF